MDISNMILENLKWKALEQISSKVWWDTASTKAIASKALPMILWQFSKNVQSESWAEALNNALNSHLWESKIDIEDGKKILWHIFWNKESAINEVAQATWQTQEDASWVMWALSSVIMETLWDQKKAAGWFGTQEITKLLSWTWKDTDILGMVMDQDGDWDFDSKDAMSFGLWWFKDKFLWKK